MLMLSPLKSMQQIASLIITFLVYVECIRNSGSGGSSSSSDILSNNDVQHNYESNSSPIYSEEDNYFTTQQSLTQMPSAYVNSASNHQSNEFRPSQIIDFTTSDATGLHRYPPSYLEPDYKKMFLIQKQEKIAQVRYDEGNLQQQFGFPNEQYLAGATSNNYNYQTATNKAQLQSSSVLVPTQLQSTPILTYRDPNTNENHYHYTPTETNSHNSNNNNKNDNYYYNQYQRQPVQQQREQPQEYTVQSSLLVDSNNNNLEYQQQQQQQQQQTTHRVEQQRPGYVFDEQLSPSYERPINANKYAQYQQYSNAIPNYIRELPERIPPPPPPRTPAATSQRLSYDSHDYPPPSYLQQQQPQQQPQQQQISNFQSPERQDTSSSSPYDTTATSSSPNYANNFGNYLQGEQYYQPPQNYKRPPSHFTNDVQYAPPPPAQFAGRPPQKPLYKPTAGGAPPSYNNYYQYQQGEIPPSPNYSNYRPPYPNYRPPPSQQIPPQLQQPSGLETLAQYAPQFTNLLLGTIGGGGGGGSSSSSSSSPLGSLLGAFTGGGGGASALRPPNMQLIKALENIARNDDLQCVPKVLCTMIAGQTQRGQLPSFITSPAITNFLTGFPVASPALIYGRAALLGISGGERSCTQSYAKCPKNEYEIIYYLNNHRGGFFKFFSEPEEQSGSSSSSNAAQHTSANDDGGNTSIFSILSALTGSPVAAAVRPTTTPRPIPKPTAASFDITNGIGSFFTNMLSEYLTGGGVEYQRRRRRSLDDEETENNEREAEVYEQKMPEDFHDEEDEEDTHDGTGVKEEEEEEEEDEEEALTNAQFGDVESRILHKELTASNEPKFFPQDNQEHGEVELKNIVMNFNKEKSVRKLKFPSATEVRDYKEVEKEYQFQPDEREASEEDDNRGGKQIHFKDDDETEDETYNPLPENYESPVHYISTNEVAKDTRRGKKVVFKEADEVGDGDQADTESNQLSNNNHEERRVIFPDDNEQHIRKGRILNNIPYYGASYSDYVRTSPDDDRDRFVLPNSHRKPNTHRRPNYRDDSNASNNYNSAYYAQSSNVAQSNYAAQTNIYTNSGSNHGGNRYSRPAAATSSQNSNYPNYSSSASSSNSNSNSNSISYNRDQYNYPNNNYVSSNRYGSDYQPPRTTRSPPPPPREDDKNVYVTDSRGVLSYYLTPAGRRVPI